MRVDISQCHFCILLVKANLRSSPDSRGGEIGSTSCEKSVKVISKEPAHLQPSLQIVYHYAADKILYLGHPDWILDVH